jgi:hypothetical protein
MNWFQKLFKQSKADSSRKATVVARPIRHEMTLERWQADDGLVNWAKQSQEFAYVLSIALNHRPSGFPLRGQPVTEIQCGIELGRHEGYSDLENILLSLRQFPIKAAEEIPADYDNTEYPQANEG